VNCTGPGGGGGAGAVFYHKSQLPANVSVDTVGGRAGTAPLCFNSGTEGSDGGTISNYDIPMTGFLYNIIEGDQIVCEAATPAYIFGSDPKGGNGIYDITWEESTDNNTWVLAAGINGLQIFAPGGLVDTTYYRRIVISGDMEEIIKDTSNIVIVKVVPIIFDNTISGDTIICMDDIPDPIPGLAPTGGDGVYRLLWEESNDLVVWNTATETSSGQNYTPGSLIDTTYLRRVIFSGPDDCCIDTSNVVSIIVLSYITNNSITSNQTVCFGNPADSLKGSDPKNGDGNYIYTWEKSADNIAWLAASAPNNNRDFDPGIPSDTIYYRRVVFSGLENCCKDTSNVITIINLSVIANNSITADQTICEGFTPNYLNGSDPTGGDFIYRYLWEESYENSTWNTATETSDGENYYPGVLTDTIYYRRIIMSGLGDCCIDTSNKVTITVLPLIQNNTIAGDTTICQQGIPLPITGATPQKGNGSYNYSWEESYNLTAWNSAPGTNDQINYSPGVHYILPPAGYIRRV